MMDDTHKLVEPKDPLPTITLSELSETIQKACKSVGWSDLMPVQKRAIPYLLAKRDLMVQSRTGSGKTGAFVLPMLDRIDFTLPACQALVLVPTRELARQVFTEAEKLGRECDLKAVAVYGGVGYGPQIKALQGGAHLVVGTPGRVLDHLIKGTFDLNKLRLLVFDEADRMLSMGFYPDMRKVKTFLPDKPLNGYLFSATYPPHVVRLAGQFLKQPDFLSLSSDQVHVAETEHLYYVVPPMDKDRALVRIIEVENPSSAFIFCNTKSQVEFVTTVLQRFGYDADGLTADLSQSKRERILKRIRDGNLTLLVATDLASRGIDIPDLSHVIQFEPPEDPEQYVHRAGRTGRAGAAGVAMNLVTGMEQSTLTKISKRFGIHMDERPLPSDDDVAATVSQRLIAMLEAQLRERDNLQLERMARFMPLAKQMLAQDAPPELVAMLLDDYYQKTLHGPTKAPLNDGAGKSNASQERTRRKRSSSRRKPK